MLCWVLVEQAQHEHMSDEYKKRYGTFIPIIDEGTRHYGWFPATDQGWRVKRTNTDLRNTCRRLTTETSMHPIGQNILLVYPHFGIDFLQSGCGRTSRGHTGGRSHSISPPSFCGACFKFSREKDSAVPFPHRP